jgi:hypothetical protein
MKKKLIIFRFGSGMPTQKEYSIIDQITGGTRRATGCGTRFGVISIVESIMTPAEIVQLFDQVAKEHQDSLPTIVLEAESQAAAFNFDPEFFEHFEECNREFDKSFGTPSNKCTMSLDELLDLVHKKGVSGLTEAELTRLKELSK